MKKWIEFISENSSEDLSDDLEELKALSLDISETFSIDIKEDSPFFEITINSGAEPILLGDKVNSSSIKDLKEFYSNITIFTDLINQGTNLMKRLVSSGWTIDAFELCDGTMNGVTIVMLVSNNDIDSDMDKIIELVTPVLLKHEIPFLEDPSILTALIDGETDEERRERVKQPYWKVSENSKGQKSIIYIKNNLNSKDYYHWPATLYEELKDLEPQIRKLTKRFRSITTDDYKLYKNITIRLD